MSRQITTVGAYGDFWDLPGVKDAYDNIHAWWDEWTGIPARLSAAITEAAQLNDLARAQGKADAAGLVGETLAGLADLRSFYQSANDKLQGVIADLKAAGFGFLPVILAGLVVAAAAAMYYVFRKTEYYESVLSDVRAGVLTPAQGTSIVTEGGAGDGSGGGSGGFGAELGKAGGDILKVAAAGTALYLGYRIWESRRRKAKRS